MAHKIFLDINILVDFLDRDREEHTSAKQLFEAIENKKIKAYFSESVINTTAYVIRKKIKVDIFKQLMFDLLLLVKVLPCTNVIVKEAYFNAKNDLEDAVLYRIALNHQLDYFITSDQKDFKKLAHQSLPVYSARSFLSLI